MQEIVPVKALLDTNKDNILDERTIKCLLKSEEDIENGRTKKALDVIEVLRAKYGF